MSDRELLELAAKAAGYGEVWYSGGCSYIGPKPKFNKPIEYRTFNPPDDDGDAQRLAVKLGLHISQQLSYVAVMQPHGGAGSHLLQWIEKYNNDPYAATRRVITRAAAEIGRNMK